MKKDIFSEGRIDWFINMRWLAIAGVVVAIVVSQYVLKFLPSEVTPYLWIGAGFLLFSNICFLILKGRIHDPRRFILFQMISDLLILTYLLYFSGGLENPFFMIFIFHIIIAGILLSNRDTYIISFITAVLFLLLAFTEHNITFVLGISAAFLLLLIGTTYFVTTIMGHHRFTHQKLIESERLTALGQLTGYIAHEVNNPIMIISSKAKLALSMKDIDIPEVIREKLRIIDRYSERVANVIKGLLGFLKPRQAAQSVPIDVNKAIMEALNLVEPKIEVQKILDWDIPEIKGRFYELVQVFINLFNNAIDAMPNGGILKVQTGSNKDSSVIIKVSDTGVGIPRENISRIFEPLFTTKVDGKGIGLGLSVVHSIIKAHNGIIDVESELGKGTTFVITVPIVLGVKEKILAEAGVS